MSTYAEYRAAIEQCGVHPLLGDAGEGWGVEQSPHELATFLAAVQLPPASTVLEIGTGYRAGLARFMTEMLGWQVTTIDIRTPDTPARLARQIIGRSDEVIDHVRGEYDLLIIDGDHHYEAVKRDFELYSPMAGIVMFHDIEGLRDCEGVSRFWGELRSKKLADFHNARYTAIADGDQRAGIGWMKRK